MGRTSVDAVIASGGGAGLLFASLSTAASGDTTIVAADSTRKIKVISYVLVAVTAVTVQWKSGASTALSGVMSMGATGGIAVTGLPSAHLIETALNQNLVLALGGAVQVSGHVCYILEA